MKANLVERLVCPACQTALTLDSPVWEQDEIREGTLLCPRGCRFPIRRFIPRFVETDAYVKSFSLEWTRHRRTQLDSANRGTRMEGVSRRAFAARVDFPLETLSGQWVLDAGCGMGRYAEVAADHQARVVGVDLSYAVDAAWDNIGKRSNVHLVQADLARLPFRPGSFDFAYSFGVLHHTPDAAGNFDRVARMVRPGGRISIFVYASYHKAIVTTSAFWRFFTTRLPKGWVYAASAMAVPLYFLYKVPLVGALGRMVLVIPMLPHWRWRWLDTFDWYSPRYQSKHTHAEVARWFEQAGFGNLKIFEGEVTMMGVKDSAKEHKRVSAQENQNIREQERESLQGE